MEMILTNRNCNIVSVLSDTRTVPYCQSLPTHGCPHDQQYHQYYEQSLLPVENEKKKKNKFCKNKPDPLPISCSSISSNSELFSNSETTSDCSDFDENDEEDDNDEKRPLFQKRSELEKKTKPLERNEKNSTNKKHVSQEEAIKRVVKKEDLNEHVKLEEKNKNKKKKRTEWKEVKAMIKASGTRSLIFWGQSLAFVFLMPQIVLNNPNSPSPSSSFSSRTAR